MTRVYGGLPKDGCTVVSIQRLISIGDTGLTIPNKEFVLITPLSNHHCQVVYNDKGTEVLAEYNPHRFRYPPTKTS